MQNVPTGNVQMSAIEGAVQAILRGPGGPRIGAFFDFDGTLIDGYSAGAYFADRLRRREMGVRELIDTLLLVRRQDLDEAEFAEVIGKGIADWSGQTVEETYALWERLFKERVSATIFPEAWQLVKAHQKMGHTVAIASSATHFQAAPLAAELGIEHVLCTQVMARNGKLTGGIVGEPLWGGGKARAVKAFARKHRVALDRSHGYANGNEDLAFLQLLGHPNAINPKPLLEETARQLDWNVMRFDRRRVPASAVARTVGAYGALAATFVGGLGYAKATGKRRRAVDLIGSIGTDAALAIAGIEVEVQGEHHMWSHRPAVFILNHQSMLDFYILLNLIRKDFTGVAKKEAEKAPGFGPFLRMADIAFVDRSNTKKAIETLQPAVERIKQGLSLAIAPEGTRSYSPKLGPFKKGAFHIAMQAGVPVVPIVVRNASAMMTRDSAIMRPGKVQVAVLAPIDVSKWKVEALDKHVDSVRQLYLDTLANWPGETRAKSKRTRSSETRAKGNGARAREARAQGNASKR